MTKFLLTLLVLVIGWTVWKRSRSAGAGDARAYRDPAPASGRQRKARVEAMVACARCGVHVPESESVMRGDRLYCGEAHAREGGP